MRALDGWMRERRYECRKEKQSNAEQPFVERLPQKEPSKSNRGKQP